MNLIVNSCFFSKEFKSFMKLCGSYTLFFSTKLSYQNDEFVETPQLFVDLFSPEYQYAPLMRIIFSHLSGVTLIKTISIVSKYFNVVVKEMTIPKLQTKCPVNKDVLVRLLSDYRIRYILCSNYNSLLEKQFSFQLISGENRTIKKLDLSATWNMGVEIHMNEIKRLLNKCPVLEYLSMLDYPMQFEMEERGDIGDVLINKEVELKNHKTFHTLKINNGSNLLTMRSLVDFTKFVDDVIEKSHNLRCMVIPKYPFRYSSQQLLRERYDNRPKIIPQVYEKEIEIVFKDHKREIVFLDVRGMIWKVRLAPKMSRMKDDSFFLFSMNQQKILLSLKVESHNSKRTLRSCAFQNYQGWGFPVFDNNPFRDGKREEYRVLIKMKYKKLLDEKEYNELTTPTLHFDDGSFDCGKTSKSMKMKLAKFDILHTGKRRLRKSFWLSRVKWTLYVSYKPDSDFFDVTLYHSDSRFVFKGSICLYINGLLREVEKQIVAGEGIGWSNLYFGEVKKIKDFSISIDAFIKVTGAMTREDYDRLQAEETERSVAVFRNNSILTNKEHTVDLNLKISKYSNKSEIHFKCLGMNWKLRVQKKRGKNNRGALFLYCDFLGEYIVTAVYTLVIMSKELGKEITLKSTTIDYVSERGWGFDEVPIPITQVEENGGCPAKISLKILKYNTIENDNILMDKKMEVVANSWINKGDTARVKLKTKGCIVPLQTDLFTINSLPCFLEVYVAGYESMNHITVCFYNEIKRRYRIYADYEISTETRSGRKTMKISDSNCSVTFPKLCEIDLDWDFEFIVSMKITKIEKVVA